MGRKDPSALVMWAPAGPPLAARVPLAACLALIALALALALMSGALALGARGPAGRSQAPLAGLAPANGLALAHMALREAGPNFLARRGGGMADLAPGQPSRIAMLARAALAREPTAGRALTALALIEQAGDPERAQALHQQARVLSRRNEISALALALAALERGDRDRALADLGQILGIRPALRAEVLPLVVGLLADEAAIGPLARMLGEQRGWSDEFWRVAHGFKPGLDHLVALRRRLLGQPGAVHPRHDEFLLQALAADGRYATAEALAAEVVPGFARGPAGFLRNAEFSARPAGRPFDWRLFASPTLDAFHDPASATLAIAAMPGPGAVVASQLVRLSPGWHRLVLVPARLAPADAGLLSITIDCASAPGQHRQEFAGPQLLAGVLLAPLSGCAHHFVDLRLAPRKGYPQGEIVIDAIRLAPVR